MKIFIIMKSLPRGLVTLFLKSYIVSVAVSILFSWISNCLEITLFNPIVKESISDQLLIGILLAPIIETYLFQYLPNYFLSKFKAINKYILFFIPGIIFGLVHANYSWLYGLALLFIGLTFNYFFLKAKLLTKNFFWYTALLHALYNLFAFFTS